MISAAPLRRNTLSGVVVPDNWINNLMLVLAGTALVAICAQISWRASFSTVPITGQTFAVLLIGALYGSRLGAATLLAYLAEGAAGLPVFAEGQGGVGAIATASGGYLFGFVVAAFVVGWFAERGFDRSRWIVLPMLVADALIYVPGLIWLHEQFRVVGLPISWETTLDYGLWPFVAGDLFKLVAAALAIPTGWAIVERFRS